MGEPKERRKVPLIQQLLGEPKYRRKVPSVHQILEMFLLQGGRLRCYRTKKPITLKNFRNTQREHVVELGLFASAEDKAAHDTPDNWRMSFTEAHAVITNGTKATSAGSSKHIIAKAKRHEKERLLDKVGNLLVYDIVPPADALPDGMTKRWLNQAKMQGGKFRKDPNRVRTVGGKVKARKPRLARG